MIDQNAVAAIVYEFVEPASLQYDIKPKLINITTKLALDLRRWRKGLGLLALQDVQFPLAAESYTCPHGRSTRPFTHSAPAFLCNRCIFLTGQTLHPVAAQIKVSVGVVCYLESSNGRSVFSGIATQSDFRFDRSNDFQL